MMRRMSKESRMWTSQERGNDSVSYFEYAQIKALTSGQGAIVAGAAVQLRGMERRRCVTPTNGRGFGMTRDHWSRLCICGQERAFDEAGIDQAFGEGGVAEDAVVEGGGGADAFDPQFGEGPFHAGD